MIPRDRVLAALNRQPVDRIPYCEHLVDMQVAQKTVGQEKMNTIIAKNGGKDGCRKF